MQSNDLGRLVAIVGGAISGAIAIIIIFGVVYSAIVLGRVPDVLSNWGGIIIGFFFGQFFSFVRAVANVPESVPEKGSDVAKAPPS